MDMVGRKGEGGVGGWEVRAYVHCMEGCGGRELCKLSIFQ